MLRFPIERLIEGDVMPLQENLQGINTGIDIKRRLPRHSVRRQRGAHRLSVFRTCRTCRDTTSPRTERSSTTPRPDRRLLPFRDANGNAVGLGGPVLQREPQPVASPNRPFAVGGTRSRASART